MIKLKGKSVYKDICIGEIFVYKKELRIIKRQKTENVDDEITRYKTAVEKAKKELAVLYDKAVKDVGEVNAAIFEVHQMLLDDLDYQESVANIITAGEVNAEYAVATTADNFFAMFSSMEDEYMKARAADIKDISERLINILTAHESAAMRIEKPSILLADDLAPSETIQLDKSQIIGFVMRNGSTNSHTAILAKSMGVPALMCVGDRASDELNGKPAILDGDEGVLYIEPDEAARQQLEAQKAEIIKRKERLRELKGKEDKTRSGQEMKVFANIGNLADLGSAMTNDASGIGLFRSEFLYLESNGYPTEEEQFRVYKQAAESMAGKKVVIRTLDIGADKQVDYFRLAKEENPALGLRAIRICLTDPPVFKTQLRALYRAALFGKLAVMYPMITSMEEVEDIKAIEDETRKELREQGIPFKEDIETGIMIETPAAALISGDLAKAVDFFSVGTNDLTQYTLALDRQNQKLERFYQPHHKAVLELIRMSADNIHKEGKWIGICGELGADTSLTETFLEMGIDEVSVSPAMVLEVREKIRETG